MALGKGDKAPDFTLPDENGAPVNLSSYLGKKVVLYFYPKDDTGGCTVESKDFSRLIDEFAKQGAVVLGMSPDSAKSHGKFRAKHDLKISLVADENKSALQAYGVWTEKSMYGRKYMGVERTTFLIGDDGTILDVWNKVKVPGHAEAVLASLASNS
ncbi:MAG: thioredoxin-dependent thiol peroxidase [Rhizobiaceae bacterium]